MKNRTPALFGFILLAIIFKGWIINSPIIGGDWPYFFKETLQGFFIMPSSWRMISGNGFGGPSIFFSLDSYVYFLVSIFVNTLHVPWEIIYKFFFFALFLILSVFSISYLLKTCFPKINGWQKLIAAIIYTSNTYVLMVVGGGQMGFALAYGISPLVLCSFIKPRDSTNLRSSLLLGVLLAILVMLDLRITYEILFAVTLYYLFNIKRFISNFSYLFIVPFSVSLLLHAFWILPLFLASKNPGESLGTIFTSVDAVKFFSFAKFENTISLLHPNWPENIFGKVSFMKPEFLSLPILAFSSLLFLGKEEKKRKTYILYFALLGLIGAFLAKGAQEPFGQLYLWLFQHVPGFIMFRDPTKWYTLIAISYSILIPFSISKIYTLLKSQSKYIHNLFLLIVFSFMLFLIRPALLGQLGGTFAYSTVPQEYLKLESFLSTKTAFSRTLWIPQIQRFAFYTNNHPGIAANDLFQKKSAIADIKLLRQNDSLLLLQQSSIKYVLIPYDNKGEIFVADRKYDDKKYLQAVKSTNSIPFLKRLDGFGKIVVYEVPSPKDHFWSVDENMTIDYEYINPTKYLVKITNARKGGMLIFSESYDTGWIAKIDSSEIMSNKYENRFNSFILPKKGNYNLEIHYKPQDLVNIGAAISISSLLVILSALFWIKKS